ncbi:Gfo/Idh/MocA family protein [Arthrobacter oryzae]|uniref:Gfo/Idh/MocA family protein n=1 Tax=Arthrobacter oryzae TaxID=409290 RepID=UPI00273B7FC7|nr:Gfo/Idh/MocA family oxidoreductase [Arthrobacter oryzae]WLQ05092.1 Gfo/Idh/MocA family oxidoreductase [Arthrobacter oryzae]
MELAGIVTRSPVRRAEAVEEYPDVPLYDSLTDLLAAGVDAVVITTPPETRRELVLEATKAGVHVVADKPFAPDAEVGRELVKAAADAGVILNVFHNRRWDTDIRTLRSVLESGAVGQVARFESRFDLDQPDTLEALVARELRLLGSEGSYVSQQGAYHRYYEPFALAVAGKGPEPVPGAEAVHTLEVLDAARLSDAERRSVDLEG